MNGAREYYDLFKKVGASQECKLQNVTSICKNIRGYGETFFQYENILFILNTHARGKTFRIWLYEKDDIADYLNDESIEVYGVTEGNPGWTETYGWTKDGTWVIYVNNYINSLKLFAEKMDEQNRVTSEELEREKKEKEKAQFEKFNSLFPNDGKTILK